MWNQPKRGFGGGVARSSALGAEENKLHNIPCSARGSCKYRGLRLPDKTVLFRFNNAHAKELYDISRVERGLYVFSIRASGDNNIQSVDLVFMEDGPPRDMLLISVLLGLVGIIVFFIPTLSKGMRVRNS
ncbi:MAG: hypothetical protein QXZ11_01100 [Thermoproteota archaeon]